MNANTLVRDYDAMTPDERTALFVSACGRGDETEADRIQIAAKRVAMTVPDTFSRVAAIHHLAFAVFTELADQAAGYLEALHRVHDIEECEIDDGRRQPWKNARAGKNHDAKPSTWQRHFDLLLAHGYLLQTKGAGWKLWCERRGFAPFSLWMDVPGFNRLQRGLRLVEGTLSEHGPAAFTEEGFRAWLTRNRPDDIAEGNHVFWTVERFADGLEQMFQDQVRFHGG